MKSKEEIAKIVCGENNSLDVLAEKGFYLTGDIIQIDSQNCISSGEINETFQPEKIILDFCKKRNINIDTTSYREHGSHGIVLSNIGNPIIQAKLVLGILQSRYFINNGYYNIFSNMQPYTREMIEKFGYCTKTWNDRVIIEEARIKKDSLTKEERELFKGYLTKKEAFELSEAMKFYLCISMIATYKEKMNRDYIIINQCTIDLHGSNLKAIKMLGADITECVNENGNQVLFIDLRKFRADKESILDTNLIKECLPEVIDSQEDEKKEMKIKNGDEEINSKLLRARNKGLEEYYEKSFEKKVSKLKRCAEEVKRYYNKMKRWEKYMIDHKPFESNYHSERDKYIKALKRLEMEEERIGKRINWQTGRIIDETERDGH